MADLSTSEPLYFLLLDLLFFDLLFLNIEQLSIESILLQIFIHLNLNVLLIFQQPIKYVTLHLFLKLIHLIQSQPLI